MNTIIYLHGFNSGPGKKVETLKQNFPNFNIISPQLTFDLGKDIATIVALINENQNIHLVGTSLGGFYALIVNLLFKHRDDLLLYLINPSLTPHKTLKKYLGKKLKNYVTDEEFEISEKFLKSLELQSSETLISEEILPNLYFFSGLNDEEVNHEELLTTLNSFNYPYNLYQDQQDHQFADITPIINQINKNLVF